MKTGISMNFSFLVWNYFISQAPLTRRDSQGWWCYNLNFHCLHLKSIRMWLLGIAFWRVYAVSIRSLNMARARQRNAIGWGQTNRQTNRQTPKARHRVATAIDWGQTHRQTDRQTPKARHRVAWWCYNLNFHCLHLKSIRMWLLGIAFWRVCAESMRSLHMASPYCLNFDRQTDRQTDKHTRLGIELLRN